MFRKILVAAFPVFILAGTVFAADSDNAAPSRSFFEGVWAGSWSNFYEPSNRQEITLTIEKGEKKGVFRVEYAWGMFQYKNRTTPAGSVKTQGREEGDQFFTQWKTKQGDDRKLTLQKESENKVKARFERGGTLPTGEQPTIETYLTRK